eukprot:TRINITY_DN2344_c0_g1_i1.p1 TRINITY_DN2344_c0_g1~~TRINITY_DN2344_c0_g1_i1.p1  ORF type:complete len:256 (-),score=13.35 TRINITY_DN2344_c0_g1_i1:335-1102(-)
MTTSPGRRPHQDTFLHTVEFITPVPTPRAVMCRASKRELELAAANQRAKLKPRRRQDYSVPIQSEVELLQSQRNTQDRRRGSRFQTNFNLPDQTTFKLGISKNQADFVRDGRMLSEHQFRDKTTDKSRPDFRTHFHLPNNQQIRLEVAKETGNMLQGAPSWLMISKAPKVDLPFQSCFPKLSNERNLGNKEPYFKGTVRDPFDHDLCASTRLRKLFPKAASPRDECKSLKLTFAPLRPKDRLYTLDGQYHQDPRY